MLRKASAIGASRRVPNASAIRYATSNEKMMASPAARLIVGQRLGFRLAVNHFMG